MLNVYCCDSGKFCHKDADSLNRSGVVWVDLLSPDDDEIRRVEERFSIHLPTPEEMQEIEVSSRLYEENGAYFMTITGVAGTLSEEPSLTQVTFILKDGALITLRHADMRTLSHFPLKAAPYRSGLVVLVAILEVLIDLNADGLEKAGQEIESISSRIFAPESPTGGGRNFHLTLKAISKAGERGSKVRESLVSIERLQAYMVAAAVVPKTEKDLSIRLKTLSRDIFSLLDHVSFQGGKINFLLDATLGLVSIEQNAIIKIFSVSAVVFLPPTLIASIYGMNFDFMPELSSPFGYPFALVMMVASALVPYLFFKWKRWL